MYTISWITVCSLARKSAELLSVRYLHQRHEVMAANKPTTAFHGLPNHGCVHMPGSHPPRTLSLSQRLIAESLATFG